MIINNRIGGNVLNERCVAFAVNVEGLNTEGFARKIARKYWPELVNIGKCKIGTVLTKEMKGITFYGLVCYSIEKGWIEQSNTICECLNSIKTNEPIAVVDIGKEPLEIRRGANLSEIQSGIEKSERKIILY